MTKTCGWWVWLIANNLKTGKKLQIQGLWNETIVLTNKKITKVVCFKYYALQQLTKLEGSMCTQKTMKEKNERLLKATPIFTIF
jgi:hypothetical protein